MRVFYRISDASNTSKIKFSHATKKHCLENFLQHFPAEIINIYADKVHSDTLNWLNTLGCNIVETNCKSNSDSFLNVLNQAILLPKDETVYFVEDDYLHLLNSYNVLQEGLQIADYVSLYDHPDKYISEQQGGNPFVESDGGEVTKVYLSKSTHWKLTNSTTMTFAASVNTLISDYSIWQTYCQTNIPHDFDAFMHLRNRVGRSLITPIPGYSTHCETKWAGPLMDWSTI